VLELFESFSFAAEAAAGGAAGAPFRMPVQDVYRLDERRIVAGTVESGTLRIGDEVVFLPSARRARVKTIEAFASAGGGGAAAPARAEAGEATGFTLDAPVLVARGEVAARADQPAPRVADRLRASVFWLGEAPLVAGREYGFRIGAARARAVVVDAPAGFAIGRNEVAECTLQLDRAIAVDLAEEIAATGRFALADGFDLRGGGLVREALAPAKVRAAAAPGDGAAARAIAPAVVWLTGLPGAGKTTIGRAVVAALAARGARAELLDGDEIRARLGDRGFGRDARDAHVRRVGWAASLLEKHGVVAVVALVSPYEESRRAARAMCRRFVEVHVSTPLAECERRDPKGLYARARRGEIAAFTGVADPYEPPTAAELTLDASDAVSVDDAVARILARLAEPEPRA